MCQHPIGQIKSHGQGQSGGSEESFLPWSGEGLQSHMENNLSTGKSGESETSHPSLCISS